MSMLNLAWLLSPPRTMCGWVPWLVVTVFSPAWSFGGWFRLGYDRSTVGIAEKKVAPETGAVLYHGCAHRIVV
jgi:hypothetical protein